MNFISFVKRIIVSFIDELVNTIINLNNLGGDDFEVRNNTDIDPAEFFTSQKMEQYQKPQSDVEEEAILTTAQKGQIFE